MTGATCNAHLATTIARKGCHGRDVVLCQTFVPPGVDRCPDCGEDSPAIRIERFCQNVQERNGNGGDVEKTAMRGHRRLKRKAA